MPVSTLLNFRPPKTERMRQRLESWLLKNWYATDKAPNLILWALEPVYRCLLMWTIEIPDSDGASFTG